VISARFILGFVPLRIAVVTLRCYRSRRRR
jgi:hypothetical protein